MEVNKVKRYYSFDNLRLLTAKDQQHEKCSSKTNTTCILSLKVPLLTVNLAHCQLKVVQASLIDRAERGDKRQTRPSHGGIYYTKGLAQRSV